jgi:hypothetical protein
VVDDKGRWQIAPLESLPEPGWHWYTATQTLEDRRSPSTGVANYTAEDLGIDPNSLTVNGERVGGIDQEISWPGDKVLTLGARIVACSTPLTPTLLADYYSLDDVLMSREVLAPESTDDNGNVTFAFRVPRREMQAQWTLALSVYCDKNQQTKALISLPHPARYQAGILDWLERKIDCWFGTCKDPPPPPPPPQPCQGCSPLPKEKTRPKPDFFGPDADDKVYL